MFGALADRGLRGLKRVIADDHKGLHAAAVKVSRFLQHAVAHQRRPVVIKNISNAMAHQR